MGTRRSSEEREELRKEVVRLSCFLINSLKISSNFLLCTLYRRLGIFPFCALASSDFVSEVSLFFSWYASVKVLTWSGLRLMEAFGAAIRSGAEVLGLRQKATMTLPTTARVHIHRVGRKDSHRGL